ncbi:hypothetical protein [Streptomyces pseudovenezuelae]|uniref:Uncharacterized protein n=1 Tax=Streptomyces pseudovenezuelae TaxID=67350 RepID=A0ABT6LZE5_9ACTN|nr:hypothetical protein [Streptomyces pseudovenezuelae]MDH6221673.1 hypothetical protein [Streptomyces pseudovenezuelae]
MAPRALNHEPCVDYSTLFDLVKFSFGVVAGACSLVFNYAASELLQLLQQHIRRCNADTAIQHGDIAALALDAYLRAHGYPPQPTSTT